MPTVLRTGYYRFFSYSGNGMDPPHVHVERGDHIAKYWLNPTCLQSPGGFSMIEQRRIYAIISRRHRELMEGWIENFSN